MEEKRKETSDRKPIRKTLREKRVAKIKELEASEKRGEIAS